MAGLPHEIVQDCSQGFCSVYCPQWCFIVQPPPPPRSFAQPEDAGGTGFSPFFIAVIGILGSALILVLYYAIFSRYCDRFETLRRRRRSGDFTDNLPLDWWYSPADGGLEEPVIRSIRVIKFVKGEETAECSDCSICLGEFQDEEHLRQLPKCTHAFHIPCIDVWLRSHSTCPLCRADVVPPPSPGPSPELQLEEEEEEEEEGEDDGAEDGGELRSVVDQGDKSRSGVLGIRRSFSVMDGSRLDLEVGFPSPPSTDERRHVAAEYHKESTPSRKASSAAEGAISCGANMAAPPMKRSFSSSRFAFTRHGRWRSSILPF